PSSRWTGSPSTAPPSGVSRKRTGRESDRWRPSCLQADAAKPRTSRMRTPASIKGHPIHGILVTLPVGLLLFSLVSDLVLPAWLGDGDWAVVARCTLAAGIATAVFAAVAALLDCLSLSARPRRRATWS